MNAKHFLLHIVRHQPRRTPREELAKAFSEHVRKTLSRENISRTLREQLAAQQRNRLIAEQLAVLERELAGVTNTHSERVRRLLERIQTMQEKLQKR